MNVKKEPIVFLKHLKSGFGDGNGDNWFSRAARIVTG